MTQLELDERKLKFIEANMKFEGFRLSEKTKEIGKKILKGDISGDEVVRSCLDKYTRGPSK
jgi:hypothetical protein